MATTYAKTITLDGKRIKIDARVPRFQLDWYIPRFHVGTPDSEIETDVKNLCAKNPLFTPAITKQTIAYALYVHRKNQKLYSHVMTGTF